ncbi:TPA: HNH endonuclease [Stenotrophomonas maltophilia]
MFKERTVERFKKEFGGASRTTAKVTAWDVGAELGVVVQTDQPNREEAAYVWLPYPPDGQPVPELALEYPGEAGRHSNTYASPGLERGKPALKLVLRDEQELDDTITYIRAFQSFLPLPELRARPPKPVDAALIPVDVAGMPHAPEIKPRREAIPRAVQREVWQRDGGRCVECGTKEKLCFDHIVPFSRGGSNTVRNLQLLCEPCNLSKGNRL